MKSRFWWVVNDLNLIANKCNHGDTIIAEIPTHGKKHALFHRADGLQSNCILYLLNFLCSDSFVDILRQVFCPSKALFDCSFNP